ncbi:hypothetical protein [Paenibacillus agricola]|uniref:C2H2-type domain-containing protein n=1 Tax=Paenibacillus agricola TaxID=2716264 RepID=A0ABX0JD12_9BACL|nr:hypothetical protein [Paenibacillus agricola]NHN34387.1 hypothetical protein [Paenibacillus agricola]
MELEHFVWLVKGDSMNRVTRNGQVYSLYFEGEGFIELLENGWTLIRISTQHPFFQSFAAAYPRFSDTLLPWANHLLSCAYSCPACHGPTIYVPELDQPDFCCSRCGKKQLHEFIDLLLHKWMRHAGKETVVAFINGYCKEICESMSFFTHAGDLSTLADQIWIEAFDEPFFSGTRQYAVAQKMLKLKHGDNQLAYFRSHLERKLLYHNQMYEPCSPKETISLMQKLTVAECIEALLGNPVQLHSVLMNTSGVLYRSFKSYELSGDAVAGNLADEQEAIEMIDKYIECGSSTTTRNGQITEHEQYGLLKLRDGTYYPAWLTFTTDSPPGLPKNVELYFHSMPGQSVEWKSMVRFLHKDVQDIFPLQYRTITQNQCVTYPTNEWQELTITAEEVANYE